MAETAIAYFRVSTAAQGQSGLGIEAQQSAVEALARRTGVAVLNQFIEVESGKRNDRPMLRRALQEAKLTGSTLLIAKLDRLSRNAAFLLALRDSGVRFIAADIPNANDLTIGVLAVVAQAEREAISHRTKDALGSIKARLANGEVHISLRSGNVVRRLGNPRGSASLAKAGRGQGAGAREARKAADDRANGLRETVSTLRTQGFVRATALAKEMNRRGLVTPRGGKWHPSTVSNLLKRLGDAAAG